MAELAVEIAKAKGEDLGDVAAEIAKAATDGGKAFLDWANKIGIQTDEAKENVTTLEKSGQTSAALKNAIDAVSAAVEAQVGAWTRASGAAQNYINTVAALGEAGAALGLSGQIPGTPTGGMPPLHPPSTGPQTDVDQIRAKQEMQAQMTDELKAREIQLQTAIADTDTKSVAGLNRRIELTKQLASLKFPGDSETAQAQRDQMVHAAERRQPSGGGGGAKGQASDIQTWRDELQQKLESEGSFFKDSKADELAFWQQKVTMTAAGSKEQAQVENTIYQLRKQLAVQAERDAISEQTFAGQVAQEDYTRKRALIEAEVTMGKLSASEGAAQEQTLLDQKWALDEGYFEKKLAAATNDLEETKKLEEEEFLAHQKMLADKQALDIKAAEATKARWNALISPLKSSLQSAAQGVAMGTQTLPQAAQNVGSGALAAIIDKLSSTLFDKLGDLFTSILPDVLKSALGIGEQAASTAAIVTGQEAAAGTTVAGVGAALAASTGAIVAAIETSAAVVALTPKPFGFAGGSWSVPAAAGGWSLPSSFGTDNVLAALTPGEMVLPVPLANAVRGGALGGAGGHTFNINLSAIDTRTGVQFLMNNAHGVVAALNKAVRNGSPIRSS